VGVGELTSLVLTATGFRRRHLHSIIRVSVNAQRLIGPLTERKDLFSLVCFSDGRLVRIINQLAIGGDGLAFRQRIASELTDFGANLLQGLTVFSRFPLISQTCQSLPSHRSSPSNLCSSALKSWFA
jgi:hypothetical protein